VLEFACPPATGRVGELEGPQEVGSLRQTGKRNPSRLNLVPCLFKVRPNSEDFVDKILDAKDVVFSKRSFDHLVIGEWHPLFVDLSVATLVDQLANCLEVGLARERSTYGYT
jgi:hypothetical protein